MKRVTNCLAVLACLLLAGCASQMTATTDVDNSVDFSAFQTFGWIDPNPLIRSVTARPLSPLVQQRLMADTKEILTEQGLRFVEDAAEADLAVAFTIGSREGIRVESFPTSSFQRGPRGRRGYTWGGYWGGSTVRTRTYTEGQLAVDLFDVVQARPVWHGTTSTRVTRSDREAPDELIREALEAILAEFPPG
ncbi:MAG: DUF4136 domain-containing protein [Chromatiales bacterium]|nr:MAG: DUF4136 domain-containing protein [Chromatiales bacterium]